MPIKSEVYGNFVINQNQIASKVRFKMLLKTVLINLFLSGLMLAIQAESYDNRYDNVDLDEILQSERLLTNYIKCLGEKGPCTPDGKLLKGMYSIFNLFWGKLNWIWYK